MASQIILAHDSTVHEGEHPESIAAAADVADLLVAYLEQIGVEYVFGIPGGAIEPLFNALARSGRRGGLRHVLARHEAGAAFMADGYARETGRLGVCCSTSGPGATNLITGVACAHDNEIPMLVITGQPALPVFGRNALQESACTGINTLSMLRHCTRYNSLVSHPKQFEAKLISALQAATRSPRGPAHLSFPVDVFRSPSPHPAPSYDLQGLLQPASLLDDDAVTRLQKEIRQAKKLVLVIGGWCGEAVGSILQLAALKNAQFVTTPDGKGLVNPQHPLFRGVFGFGGHASADAALKDPAVDLILAIGTSLGEWNSGGWSEALLNERLVHIDESEDHLASTPMARLHVRGRILTIVDRLIERDAQADAGTHERHRASRKLFTLERTSNITLAEPDKFDSDATPITPQRLMKELGRRFPPTTRFLADTGNSVAWATHYLHPGDRRTGERRLAGGDRRRDLGRREGHGGWLRVIMDFASMGWAIGAAVGTAAGNPKAPVVCITGDGSMLMNGQELHAAVAEKLAVVFVVLNDRALGMVKHGQRLAKAEQIGCDMPPTDFAALARALGAEAYTIHGPDDLAALDIDAICTRKGPTLLDVHVDPAEVPPMKVRMKVLTAAQ
ncbi:MAG TPA: thiamine pyrophosphate-binding protein [Rhodocyclaceae bacterium]|nr:thiamine pyrophosphate-binding protein [Rhodocyclaceae bacterium]